MTAWEGGPSEGIWSVTVESSCMDQLFIKEAPESSLTSSTPQGHREGLWTRRWALTTQTQNLLAPWPWAGNLWAIKNKFLLLISHCFHLENSAMAAKQIQTAPLAHLTKDTTKFQASFKNNILSAHSTYWQVKIRQHSLLYWYPVESTVTGYPSPSIMEFLAISPSNFCTNFHPNFVFLFSVDHLIRVCNSLLLNSEYKKTFFWFFITIIFSIQLVKQCKQCNVNKALWK